MDVQREQVPMGRVDLRVLDDAATGLIGGDIRREFAGVLAHEVGDPLLDELETGVGDRDDPGLALAASVLRDDARPIEAVDAFGKAEDVVGRDTDPTGDGRADGNHSKYPSLLAACRRCRRNLARMFWNASPSASFPNMKYDSR